MPAFGKSSLDKLQTVHPTLRRVFDEVIKTVDCKILEGHRSIERQRALYSAGLSRIDGVKKRGMHNHSPSLAVDCAPYPIDWKNYQRFREFAKVVIATAANMGIVVRWGGDWDRDGDTTDQKFNDLVHFELVED